MVTLAFGAACACVYVRPGQVVGAAVRMLLEQFAT